MNLADQSMAELARTLPGATAVFHDYRLNFCCEGGQTLRRAAEARGLDVESLTLRLEELRREHGSGIEGREAITPELIYELRGRHRRILDEDLPELIRLARKVENVHARHPQCPRGLTLLLSTMAQELDEHVRREDEQVFPALVDDGADSEHLSALRDEHEQQGENLRALEALTGDMTPPERACPTWQALYNGLRQLRRDLIDDVHLENNVLFAGAEAC